MGFFTASERKATIFGQSRFTALPDRDLEKWPGWRCSPSLRVAGDTYLSARLLDQAIPNLHQLGCVGLAAVRFL